MSELKKIFTPAVIHLPEYASESALWEKWSVIACDQFTSQPDYWAEVERIVGEDMSTYKFVLPEAYLGTDKEFDHKKVISASAEKILPTLKAYDKAIVYLERELPDGRVRAGIVGKIDLLYYNYEKGSNPAICATEETVIERIPARVETRANSVVEMPHAMLFFDDEQNKILSYLSSVKDEMKKLYDFTLMCGGGSIKGYLVEGEQLDTLYNMISEYESSKDGAVYAVGDGNHSLAAAKAWYGMIREKYGDDADLHPARYALCELINIHDDAIDFEPIYRILKNVNAEEFLSELPDSGHKVTAVVGESEREVYFPESHILRMGSMQNYIDAYLLKHPQVECDYIHGEDVLRDLAKDENTIGFLCDGIEKENLLTYVSKYGSLPRKTFSMGTAYTKRYYLETRYIRE